MEIAFNTKEKGVFKRLGVSAVVLFGSQATGLARDDSDFDFGILVNNPTLLSSENRLKIYDRLYSFFSEAVHMRDVDIVFLQIAPAELQMHAAKKGQVLYEEKPGVFANFKAETMLQYADFAPLREIFHSGILSRIK